MFSHVMCWSCSNVSLYLAVAIFELVNAEGRCSPLCQSWNGSRYVGTTCNAAKPCKPKLQVPTSLYPAVKDSVIRAENTERKKWCKLWINKFPSTLEISLKKTLNSFRPICQVIILPLQSNILPKKHILQPYFSF